MKTFDVTFEVTVNVPADSKGTIPFDYAVYDAVIRLQTEHPEASVIEVKEYIDNNDDYVIPQGLNQSEY